MATLLNEADLDPSYYLVFQGALKKWLERSNSLPLSTFVSIVSVAVRGLVDSTVPSTGVSLTLVWTVAHPIVPSTLGEWDAFNQLLVFMDDFDNSVASQHGNILWF